MSGGEGAVDLDIGWLDLAGLAASNGPKRKQGKTRWWQLKHFLFSPQFGEGFHFDDHIFQMGGSTTNQKNMVCRSMQCKIYFGPPGQMGQMLTY